MEVLQYKKLNQNTLIMTSLYLQQVCCLKPSYGKKIQIDKIAEIILVHFFGDLANIKIPSDIFLPFNGSNILLKSLKVNRIVKVQCRTGR